MQIMSLAQSIIDADIGKGVLSQLELNRTIRISEIDQVILCIEDCIIDVTITLITLKI